MPKPLKTNVRVVARRPMTPQENRQFNTALMSWLKHLVDKEIANRSQKGSNNAKC